MVTKKIKNKKDQIKKGISTQKAGVRVKTARKQPRKVSVVVAVGSEKNKIIQAYATKTGDTGSPEVQIALITHRINKLVSHLKNNPQDQHSRRGLLGMISKRRRLLNYLAEKDNKRYQEILKKVKFTETK